MSVLAEWEGEADQMGQMQREYSDLTAIYDCQKWLLTGGGGEGVTDSAKADYTACQGGRHMEEASSRDTIIL